MLQIRKLVKFYNLIIIALIRCYQIIVSPLMRSSCRYIPTCSEYAINAIRKYGIVKGILLSIKRISRCHPLGGQGHDPVP